MRVISSQPATTSANADPIERFIDRIGALAPNDWLGVVAAVERMGEAHAAACEKVSGLVRQNLAVSAWTVIDDVQTAAHASLAAVPPFGRSRHAAAHGRIAQRAAEMAALALLVRPHLDTGSFDVLHAPFAPPGPRLVHGDVGPQMPPGSDRPRLAGWQKWIFRRLARLERTHGDAYGLPANRVEYVEVPVDLGASPRRGDASRR